MQGLHILDVIVQHAFQSIAQIGLKVLIAVCRHGNDPVVQGAGFRADIEVDDMIAQLVVDDVAHETADVNVHFLQPVMLVLADHKADAFKIFGHLDFLPNPILTKLLIKMVNYIYMKTNDANAIPIIIFLPS